MSVHIITIAQDGDAWVVKSARSLYERFPQRPDAMRHANALARAASKAGEEAVVRIMESETRRAA